MSHEILKALGLGNEQSGTYLGQGEWSKTTDAGSLRDTKSSGVSGKLAARIPNCSAR